MHRRNTTATFNAFQVIRDIVAIAAAFFAASGLYFISSDQWLMGTHLWMLLAFELITVLMMFMLRMYNYTTFNYIDRIFLRTFVSLGVSALFVSALVFLFQLETTSRLLFGFFLSLSCVFVSVSRVLLRHFHMHSDKNVPLAVFMGNESCYGRYAGYVAKTDLRVNFIKVIDPQDKVAYSLKAFEDFLAENNVGEVVFSYRDVAGIDYQAYCSLCEEMGVTVRLVMNMLNLPRSNRYLSSIGTYPVVTYHSVSLDKMQLFFKTIADFFVALAALIVTLPITLVTAAAIKRESPGPIFFKQKRAGINGKVFTIYKFRSMYIDAEARKKELMAQNEVAGGLMFKIKNDPRITKVGNFIRKTSIDELPQLLNVLRGDMSLVGTRPPTLDEVEHYQRHHRRRISIKPGITGMWQTSGRSTVLDFEKVVEMDLKYIDQWSLALDFRLLLKTVSVILHQSGAC